MHHYTVLLYSCTGTVQHKQAAEKEHVQYCSIQVCVCTTTGSVRVALQTANNKVKIRKKTNTHMKHTVQTVKKEKVFWQHSCISKVQKPCNEINLMHNLRYLKQNTTRGGSAAEVANFSESRLQLWPDPRRSNFMSVASQQARHSVNNLSHPSASLTFN